MTKQEIIDKIKDIERLVSDSEGINGHSESNLEKVIDIIDVILTDYQIEMRLKNERSD